MAKIVRIASLSSMNRLHFFLQCLALPCEYIYDHVDLFSAVTRVTSF